MSQSPSADGESVSLTQCVTELVERLRAELPSDSAEFVATPHDDGILFTVTPARAEAAKIVIYVEDGDPVAYMTLGQSSIFEVPAEGDWGYTDLPFLDEVAALCRAVFTGSFQETVWLKKGEPFRTAATVTLGGEVKRSTWRSLFSNPFTRAEKRRFAYKPYA